MPQIISPVLTNPESVQDFGAGGVLNQLPGLKATGDYQRQALTSFNDYKDLNGQQYTVLHPDALSDGDIKGKGELNPNGTVGGLIDIQTKNQLLYSSGNKFKPGNGYNNIDYPEQHW